MNAELRYGFEGIATARKYVVYTEDLSHRAGNDYAVADDRDKAIVMANYAWHHLTETEQKETRVTVYEVLATDLLCIEEGEASFDFEGCGKVVMVLGHRAFRIEEPETGTVAEYLDTFQECLNRLFDYHEDDVANGNPDAHWQVAREVNGRWTVVYDSEDGVPKEVY